MVKSVCIYGSVLSLGVYYLICLGGLILGEAAVSAGIVSPIMIIVIAITSISSLIFVEPQFTTALRVYRIAFMIGGALFGIHGILLFLRAEEYYSEA